MINININIEQNTILKNINRKEINKMNINYNTQIYCLIGHPISKTLSPIIHNNFYRLINENNIYLAFDVKEKYLSTIVEAIKILDIKGFNITIPYKTTVINYLDEISEEAKLIGAVNTVKNVDGKLVGYNTDGMGFIKSLELNNIDVKGKNILVLGAGGGAKAIGTSLALAEVNSIFISNRTLGKAKKLSEKLKYQFPKVSIDYGGLDLKKIDKKKIHMIINCTSIGMYPNIDKSPIDLDGFSKDLVVYDIVYKPINTKLLKLAQDKGYKTMDGLTMLIFQGLYSQQIWLDNKNYDIYEYYDEIRRNLEKYVE